MGARPKSRVVPVDIPTSADHTWGTDHLLAIERIFVGCRADIRRGKYWTHVI